MENQDLQTAQAQNNDTKRLHSEITEMMQRIRTSEVENTKLLDLSQKSILLALGQKVTLNTTDYSGSLRPIAEQLAKESGQLAVNLRKNESTRNCQDVMLEIMQLSMVNKGIINIHAEYSPRNDNFQVHVIAFSSSYKADEVEWLYESRVYFSFGENPLQAMLEIEDKLLEMIADAKDKAEVAA